MAEEDDSSELSSLDSMFDDAEFEPVTPAKQKAPDVAPSPSTQTAAARFTTPTPQELPILTKTPSTTFDLDFIPPSIRRRPNRPLDPNMFQAPTYVSSATPSPRLPYDIPHDKNPALYGTREFNARGSRYTKIDTNLDARESHELFLLADGEKKVEVLPVTEVANAALFKFNKEDHTLANVLRDKLFRLPHVTFVAYKVPHPLFATFELRVHTDGEITPKEAVVQASQQLIRELQILDQEFTKEFELRKITGEGPGGMDI